MLFRDIALAPVFPKTFFPEVRLGTGLAKISSRHDKGSFFTSSCFHLALSWWLQAGVLL